MAQFFIVAVLLLALPSICLGQKVVTTDPANAKINSCLAKNASQSSTLASNLNKPISGGQFTFYGNPSGAGACGQDTGKVRDQLYFMLWIDFRHFQPAGFSAAASGKLFVDSQKWVAPCSGTQWVLSDQVCINKCVKITYKCVKCTASKTYNILIVLKKCSQIGRQKLLPTLYDLKLILILKISTLMITFL
jgi:hypothetical protein